MAKKKPILVRDLECPEAGDLFAIPHDDRLVKLLRLAGAGEIPVSDSTVRLAELEVHHPPSLTKVQANLREEPGLRDFLATSMREEPSPFLLVYRNQAGRLVMFDDYAKYAVALELGLQEVRVRTLGE